MPSPLSELRGTTRPRVESKPANIVASDGDLAADLMEAAGKPLEPWQRDSVDLMMAHRPDGKWACYEYAEWVPRQSGKGALGEARVLTGLFVLGEELIIWTAHEYKTAHEAFRRMKALIRRLGTAVSETLVDVDGVLVKITNGNEESFERLDTGQRVMFIARSKSSGRGFSGDVNIIDEAFAYTPEQAEALGPTLIARPNAQIIYLSSPPLTGDSGEVMFELKDRAEAGGDDSLGYRDWGLEGNLDELGKVNLDDPNMWARVNPALGLGRVTLETIRRLRKMLSANEGRGFAREVLGLWPKRIKGGGAIDMDIWRRDHLEGGLLDPGSRRAGDVALAVDIAPNRDYAAIGIYGNREDGFGHAQIVAYKPGTDWVIDEVVRWRDALDPVAVVMGRGTAASLEVELKKVGIQRAKDRPEDDFSDRDVPKRGELHVLTATEMSGAVGNLLDAVRQRTLRHVGQRELDSSAEGSKTKRNGDTIAWALADFAADTSPLVTITGARWGFTSLAHLIDESGETELCAVLV